MYLFETGSHVAQLAFHYISEAGLLIFVPPSPSAGITEYHHTSFTDSFYSFSYLTPVFEILCVLHYTKK